MTSIRGIIIILIFLIINSACSESRKLPKNQEELALEQLIVGKWNWYQTECCLPQPEIITSETCDCSKMIEFKNGDSVYVYENDELTIEGIYSIKYGMNGPEGEQGLDMVFLLIADSYPGILTVKNDTLIIDHSFMDREKQFYVRKGK